MATKDFKLNIERRDGVGTTGSQQVRAKGRIPAIIYGHGSDSQPISVEAKALDDLLHHGGRTTLITLVDGSKTETALIREVQRNEVSHRILHADFQRVSANEAVRAKLSVVTVGAAVGVKEQGGVMDVITHEIEVEGPASRLPDNLEVDVTALGIHEHINAADVKLPDGFKLITPGDTTVVLVEASKTARLLEEAELGLEAPAQAEPEVIGEKTETASTSE